MEDQKRKEAIIFSRQPASILFSTLIISLLIATILGSIIFLIYSKYYIINSQNLKAELSRNANSGFNFALAANTLPYDTDYHLDLFEQSKDSVIIKKKRWGLFDLILVNAIRGSHKAKVKALIGSTPDTLNNTALFLSETLYPLSLVGETFIKGNAYLSKNGVRSGFYNNQSFVGKTLVEGSIKPNKPILPQFLEVENRLDHYLSDYMNNDMVVVEGLKNFTVDQPFDSTTVVFYRNGTINLSHISLSNNLIIHTSGEVLIDKTASLNNILIIGRKIVFGDGFKGAVQAIATDTIQIGENCQFRYPSVVSTFSNNNSFINFGKNTQFSGIILNLLKDKSQNNSIKTINIEEGSQITGEIIADAKLQHKGTVYGTVICNSFYLTGSSASFDNYLANATIDVSKRPQFLSTSSLISAKGKKQVIQWVK